MAAFVLTTALVGKANAAVTVSPTNGTVAVGHTVQFSYAGNGVVSSGAAITWSVWPQIGTINNSGLYTAPSSLSAATTVKIVVLIVPAATTQAPQIGFTSLTITPPVGVSINPSSVSLGQAQTQQFSASVGNASNTGVTWSISPAVGTISAAGLYTAPSTIASAQSVTVKATSVADSTKSASAAIALQPPVSITLTPVTATVDAGQSAQFTASVANTVNKAVTWSLSPAVGSISASGLYTAPQTVTTAQTVTVIATSQANSTKTASASIKLQPAASASVTLPIEVMGGGGTAQTVKVPVSTNPGLTGSVALNLQVHGLEYETQASVQVNGGSWIPLNSPTVTGLGAQYGAIGGGFNTLSLSIALPAGLVQAGTNTIAFRFNATDGNSSGYRVLWFNLQSADGTELIASSTFTQDDPSKWTAPLNDAADIAAGQSLWRTAALAQPNGSGGSATIKAHCGDCHTQDGRDLKYFNYSNNTIYARALFHGLNSTQANQIASYIRSLQTPAPSQARPWNPPYQPGPGLDSQPVTNWAAGAGLSAVLPNDAAMQPYLMPSGSTAGWAATGYLNSREMPIALQLPDWNHWLPRVHPMDAYGSSFTNNSFNTDYAQLRSDLVGADAAAYTNAVNSGDYVNWFIAQDNFVVPILEANPNWGANSTRNQVYGIGLWTMVKLWEINQEFGLEGLPQVPYGSKAEARAWYGNRAFHTSPNMLHIPAGTGLGNGSVMAQTYLSYIWYHVQLVLNDGNGQEHGQDPVDYPYVFGYTKALSQYGNNAPEAMLQLMWNIKGLQTETANGAGPGQGSEGWQPSYTDPSPQVNSAWQGMWSATSASTRAAAMQAYLQAWFPKLSSYTPQQYYQGGWANASDNPALLDGNTNFGGIMWFMLPRFRYYGVSPALTYQIANWAATVWPKGNWALNNAATCNAQLQCTSDAN